MRESLRPKLYFLVVLPFATLLLLNSHLGLEKYQRTRPLDLSDERLAFSTSEIRILSLNHLTAAADLLWLSGLMYRANRAELRQPARGFTEYSDAIIDVDPHFHAVYPWHDIFRYAARPDPSDKDLQEANRILKEGLDFFPDDEAMARRLVINTLNHRFPRTTEERIEEMQVALGYAEKALGNSGEATMMANLAMTLRSRVRRMEQGLPEFGGESGSEPTANPDDFQFLVRMMLNASNDRERDMYRRQLHQLGAEEDLIALTTQLEDQFRISHHHRFAYLNPDLFTLVDSSLYDWERAGESISLNYFDYRAGNHEQ